MTLDHTPEQSLVQIQGTEIQRITFRGEHVVTFAQVDKVHERPEGTAGRTFRENRDRFVEGEDFISLNQPDEIRRLGFTRPQGGVAALLILITKRGYLKLVKPMTDDRAWAVQGEMIDRYFAVEEAARAGLIATNGDAREARLMFKLQHSVAKLLGLAGNQAVIAANRGTRAITGFDMLAAMGSPAMPSPVNDRMINATTIGEALGVSAIKVNHCLHEMSAQEGIVDAKGRKAWRPTAYGIELGGQMMDMDRSNGTGSAQQLRWPVGIIEAIRAHVGKGAA